MLSSPLIFGWDKFESGWTGRRWLAVSVQLHIQPVHNSVSPTVQQKFTSDENGEPNTNYSFDASSDARTRQTLRTFSD